MKKTITALSTLALVAAFTVPAHAQKLGRVAADNVVVAPTQDTLVGGSISPAVGVGLALLAIGVAAAAADSSSNGTDADED